MSTKTDYKDPVILKKRAAWIGFCLILLAASVSGAAYFISKLMPYYGTYEYENKLCIMDLPEITNPSHVHIELDYTGGTPEDITIKGAMRIIRDIERTNFGPDDNGISKIFLDFDTEYIADDYTISLLPMDNTELAYDFEITPSTKFMTAQTDWYTDRNGDLWVHIRADYPVTDEQISCVINGEGKGYKPTIFDTHIDQGKDYYLNISRIITEKEIRLNDCRELNVAYFAQSLIDPDLPKTHENIYSVNHHAKSLLLSDIPEYDPKNTYPTDMAVTMAYISELREHGQIRPKKQIETEKDKDQKTDTEAIQTDR